MSKRIIVMLFVFISLLLFSSCDIKSIGGMLVSEEIKANARMEQIISAIKEKDAEALKSLFSKKRWTKTMILTTRLKIYSIYSKAI